MHLVYSKGIKHCEVICYVLILCVVWKSILFLVSLAIAISRTLNKED